MNLAKLGFDKDTSKNNAALQGAAIGATGGLAYSFAKPGLPNKPYVPGKERDAFISKLQPGDILLSGDYKAPIGGKALNAVINRNAPEFHSAVYMGGNDFAELIPKDKVPSKNTTQKDLRYALGKDSHEARRPNLTETERTKFLADVKTQMETTKYDKGSAVKGAISNKLGLNLNCSGDYCSNVISKQLPDRLFKGNKTSTMPTDFMNDSHFKQIAKLNKYEDEIHLPLSNKALAKYVAPAAVTLGVAGYILGKDKKMTKQAKHRKHKHEEMGNTSAIATGAGIGATLGAAAGFSKILDTHGSGKFNKHFTDNKYLLPVYAAIGGILGGNAGLAVNELKKEGAKKDTPFYEKHRDALAATAVGLGTFALARHGFNKTPDQIASKGKLNWALAPEGTGKRLVEPKTVTDKIKKFLRYDNTNFVDVTKAKTKDMKLEGALYHDADITEGHFIPKADISYNVDEHVINDVLQTKSEFGKLKGKLMIPTRKFEEAHPERSSLLTKNYTDSHTMAEHLAKSEKHMYYKPSVDEMSGGWGHFTTQDLVDVVKDPKYKKERQAELDHFYTNKKDYIAQDQLDLKAIEGGPDAGRPVTERRVHFGVDTGGKVKIINPKATRWVNFREVGGLEDIKALHGAAAGSVIGGAAGYSSTKSNDTQSKVKRTLLGAALGAGVGAGGAKLVNTSYAAPKQYYKHDTKELEKGLQALWSNNPQLKSKTPAVYGADIVRDVKDKPWLIEVNDQSGFFHGDTVPIGNYASHKLYKHITGKDTTVMSTAKGLGAAGVTAGGIAINNKIQDSKKSKAA